MENGKSCIAKYLNNSIEFDSTEFHVLRLIEGVPNSERLYNLIKTDRFKPITEANMGESTEQKRVPTDFPISSKFEFLQLKILNKFTEKTALIEQQKELIRQELKESEELFNCLFQKTFKAEMV